MQLDYARFSLGKFPSLLCPETLITHSQDQHINLKELALHSEKKI